MGLLLSKFKQNDTNFTLFDNNLRKKEEIIAKIIYKILIKLKYLHENVKLIHHDLKPENILITNNGNPCHDDFDIFIIDYGFSVKFDQEKEIKSQNKLMIPLYTFTYCPWELIQCIHQKQVKYSSKIDLWALGIITMELLLNGKNCIFNDKKINKFIKNKIDKMIKERKIGKYEQINFEQEYNRFLRGLRIKYHREYFLDLREPNKSTIASFVVDKLKNCGYSIECLHFVASLLNDDPNKRLNANNALKHTFIIIKY